MAELGIGGTVPRAGDTRDAREGVPLLIVVFVSFLRPQSGCEYTRQAPWRGRTLPDDGSLGDHPNSRATRLHQ